MTGWYIFGWLFIAMLLIVVFGGVILDRVGK